MVSSGEFANYQDTRLLLLHKIQYTTPWNEICDCSTIETLNTSEWAETDDITIQRKFTELLKHALEQKLYPQVSYHSHLDKV
jgi:hypothetical protein